MSEEGLVDRLVWPHRTIDSGYGDMKARMSRSGASLMGLPVSLHFPGTFCAEKKSESGVSQGTNPNADGVNIYFVSAKDQVNQYL